MVADEIVYATLGLSAATLVVLIVFLMRVSSLITKKVAEVSSRLEQTEGALLSGVSDLASKMTAPAPTPVEVKATQEAPSGMTMEGGLGGQVGPGTSGQGLGTTGGGSPEALQPGKRYKYVMDPVTRKMKLVPAD